jgi:hypothetical protein
MPKESKPAGKSRRKKGKGLRAEGSALTFTYNEEVLQDFIALLKESCFVSEVLRIYHRDMIREFEFYKKYGMAPSRQRLSQNFRRQANFMRQYLPERLYQATDTLFLEAILASIGRPMLRSVAIDLYSSIFVRRSLTSPPLREGSDPIWDSMKLRWAIHFALPAIKNPRNITLAALAARINALPRTGIFRYRKKDLTGRHLQKLLEEHGIDWKRIKKIYRRFLEEKKNKKNHLRTVMK